MLTTWFVVFGLLINYGDAANNAEPKIVNGTPASPGEFPYQVSLQMRGQMGCGGTIIDEYHVVTAAHCIRERSHHFGPRDLSVVVGSTDLRNNPGSRYQVSKVQVHKGYDWSKSWIHDIAMLKLERPIRFSRNVRPAVLPDTGASFRSGQVATATGFGRLHPNGDNSPVLHKTQVFIMSNNECQRYAYGGTVRQSNICTHRPNRITGTCKGDSGGPLTVDGEFVGIVSWSPGNGCAGRYAQVYTRVSYYRNWIEYMLNHI